MKARTKRRLGIFAVLFSAGVVAGLRTEFWPRITWWDLILGGRRSTKGGAA